jgi:CRP-like cAMP-binding protein
MRRDHDPLLARLRAIPLFSGCPRAELALVARCSTEHRALAGEVLIEQGWTARELLVIVEGSVVVRLDDRPIARLGPGDVVGEVALLDRGPRTASVVAETDVRALVSTAHEVTMLLTHAPALTRALLQATVSRLRSTTAQLTAERPVRSVRAV